VKRLVILRHAKSSWADSSISDWQRPLNERGERDAPRAGEWLHSRSLVPDLIITSDAVRARMTAEAVATAAGYTREIIIEPSLYHATPDAAIEVVNHIDAESATVMIVGHNPGFEELVEALTGKSISMPTAAIVVLDLPVNRWSELDTTLTASIVDSWRPRDS
jgi:phosphohistidine phosphatase